ncbi:hypothetical protein DFH09DRAFT_1330406 [Mycena vulgaris]|nr:hypothetical protein DFH09DRAFT_1330406 [Mycena vulgaris]
MVSRPPSPEDVSIYNDGQGLQFKVELTLVPDPKEKCRSNVKPTVKKKSFFLHEDMALNHMLYTALKSLSREEDLTFGYSPHEDKYTSNFIDIAGMTYTIPRSQHKDMSLTCNADYEIMIKEACRKTAPETIVIKIAELKQHEQGDENEESSDEDSGGGRRKKKKKKTFEPSPEEVEQNELILKLQAEWKCKDRSCRKFLCFPDRETAKHVHLTHLHIQTWSAAWQGKVINEDGEPVGLNNPPDTKLFLHQESALDNSNLIRNRKSATKDSNITINLTLPNALLPPAAPHARSHPASATAPAIHQPQRLPIPPQMTLETFCIRYDLSPHIQEKLAAYSVTGPQTLRHLKNTHLEEATLNMGEIADVRDAQDRWMIGDGAV